MVTLIFAAVVGAADLSADIDRLANETLKSTSVPSLSLAVIKDGKLVTAKAYGSARLEPKTAATPAMRYEIGSVSKQFTAAAVMMLVEQKKLSLDDKVSKYLPELTRAQELTVRELISHTAGVQDYWPQDYVPPFMTQPTTPMEILARWAKQPLDFEPASKWQYSNTGYVAAGLIVEKVSGTPLFELLRQKIFEPLQMNVANVDESPLPDIDALGYTRYGFGPPRRAPKQAKGWVFAAGELGMSAADLAKWNLAVIEHRLLSPASWAEVEHEVVLSNGAGSRYGLGFFVGIEADRRKLSHAGGMSGFISLNTIFPDDRAAITVLVNDDINGSTAVEGLTQRIVPLLFSTSDADTEARAGQIFTGLQAGKIDRTLLSANANDYFSATALKDFAAGLRPLGAPQSVHQVAQGERGGMTWRVFSLKLKGRTLTITERDLHDGKIEQFMVSDSG